jgi:demethylmenaquinone methyltransferase/2-methoxy-6-polyprenyl-1,4-benzoquinol methylase
LRLSLAWTALIFGATPASRSCRDYFMDAIANFYTPEELSEILRLVGFTQVTCAKSVWGGMVGFHKAQRTFDVA